MNAEIIKIGNSHGIRLPKSVLQQCGLEGTVELEVVDEHLTISRVKTIRDGWDKAFQEMHRLGDDKLIGEADSISNEFDRSEWEW